MAKSIVRSRKNRSGPVENPERVGSMLPTDLEALGNEAFGGRGWQKTFVRGTGLSPSTLTRYLQGVFPIPQHVAVLMEMLITLRRNNLPIPDAFSVDQDRGEAEDGSVLPD